MYDYMAVRVEANPCDENITDLLAAFLAELEFETFEPDETGVTAYVRKDKYDKQEVERVLADFPMETHLVLSDREIKGEDWNKEWEQNYFKPISIDGKLLIRSSFHNDYASAPIEIVIDPKMAFGTGHHATTAGMARMLLATDLAGKTVIDMGTGTGILAILSKKLGASDTVGIDIDEFAIENAKENATLNNVSIDFETGDEKRLEALKPADIFLANINLNVITGNLNKYVEKLKPGGLIFLSGFLEGDKPKILEETSKCGLSPKREWQENGWMTMEFINTF